MDFIYSFPASWQEMTSSWLYTIVYSFDYNSVQKHLSHNIGWEVVFISEFYLQALGKVICLMYKLCIYPLD